MCAMRTARCAHEQHGRYGPAVRTHIPALAAAHRRRAHLAGRRRRIHSTLSMASSVASSSKSASPSAIASHRRRRMGA